MITPRVTRCSPRTRSSSTWAGEDHVFPLDRAERYAAALGADLRTIAGAYTYTAEDRPEETARVMAEWFGVPKVRA